jgi:muramoyltetrapeptide carboxypeptidase LdcA involved in peptidoglycan recycling
MDVEAGHCPGKLTLPLGRLARLDTAGARLSIPGV